MFVVLRLHLSRSHHLSLSLSLSFAFFLACCSFEFTPLSQRSLSLCVSLTHTDINLQNLFYHSLSHSSSFSAFLFLSRYFSFFHISSLSSLAFLFISFTPTSLSLPTPSPSLSLSLSPSFPPLPLFLSLSPSLRLSLPLLRGALVSCSRMFCGRCEALQC